MQLNPPFLWLFARSFVADSFPSTFHCTATQTREPADHRDERSCVSRTVIEPWAQGTWGLPWARGISSSPFPGAARWQRCKDRRESPPHQALQSIKTNPVNCWVRKKQGETSTAVQMSGCHQRSQRETIWDFCDSQARGSYVREITAWAYWADPVFWYMFRYSWKII